MLLDRVWKFGPTVFENMMAWLNSYKFYPDSGRSGTFTQLHQHLLNGNRLTRHEADKKKKANKLEESAKSKGKGSSSKSCVFSYVVDGETKTQTLDPDFLKFLGSKLTVEKKSEKDKEVYYVIDNEIEEDEEKIDEENDS